jgi:two-component sensor histidine kinase
LLLQVSWAGASLVDIVRDATEPFQDQAAGRFLITGPDVEIASSAVIALALTFNELCTNTTKFGALTMPTGRIEIAWTIDEETQRLLLTWTEKSGPVVDGPTRRSFGTRMMEALGQQLSGRVQLAYEPTGSFTRWMHHSVL